MMTKTEKTRLIFGAIIVFGIFAFIFASSFFEKQKDLENMLNVDAKYSADLPNNFCAEVVDVNSINATDVKVSQDEKIVGFNMSLPAEKSFSIIKNKLNEKNWKCIDSSNYNYANFIKDEGEYTWLFINCVDVGGGCSVIFTKD